jgi:peptide deformylase
MEIIKIHYKISKPVVSYKEIKAEAEAMRRFIVLGQFKGYYNKAFAITHCQVSETPFAFFVVAPECLKEKMFVDDVVINPQIVEAPLYKNIAGNPEALKKQGLDPEKIKAQSIKVPNAIEYQEPCMSFPYRTPKRITRYDVIKVKYQTPSLFGMKTVEAELKGIASEIFQHEFDHTQGKNIYFTSETPVKWWELIGTAKSLGGTSLDAPEGLNLKKASEKATEKIDIEK